LLDLEVYIANAFVVYCVNLKHLLRNNTFYPVHRWKVKMQLLWIKFILQAIEWLCEARSAIRQAHRALGKSYKDVEKLIKQHDNIQVFANSRSCR